MRAERGFGISESIIVLLGIMVVFLAGGYFLRDMFADSRMERLMEQRDALASQIGESLSIKSDVLKDLEALPPKIAECVRRDKPARCETTKALPFYYRRRVEQNEWLDIIGTEENMVRYTDSGLPCPAARKCWFEVVGEAHIICPGNAPQCSGTASVDLVFVVRPVPDLSRRMRLPALPPTEGRVELQAAQ